MLHTVLLILFLLMILAGLKYMWRLLTADDVARSPFLCPYCPRTVKWSQRINEGPRGWGHAECTKSIR